jgi:hypothetical protein
MKRCRCGDESQSWRKSVLLSFVQLFVKNTSHRARPRSRRLALTGVYVFSSREFTAACFRSVCSLFFFVSHSSIGRAPICDPICELNRPKNE